MRGGGSLKASLARVFSLVKSEHAMPQKDNCGECGLGFNPHQEHYHQVNLPSVLSSPNGEGNGINSITNLSPYRPNALLTKCSTLVLRLAMNATARFCAKSSTLLSSQARLFASKACFVAPLGLAFTMAEILLSLTIIGVVAAITLPSLTGNINERTWNTQRKALHSRLSQAVALMPQIRGYGNVSGVISSPDGYSKHFVYSSDTATEAFLTTGLAKVYKINNICDKDHLADCGLPSQIVPLGGGSKVDLLDLDTTSKLYDGFDTSSSEFEGGSLEQEVTAARIGAASFESANGESILVHYNPSCIDESVYWRVATNGNYVSAKSPICVNFIYDLNGKKGPNTVGKDIGFMTAMSSSDPYVVAPMPIAKEFNSVTYDAGKKLCSSNDVETRLPSVSEMISMGVNNKLLNFENSNYWTSSLNSNGLPYYFYVDKNGNANHVWAGSKNSSYYIRCVKR